MFVNRTMSIVFGTLLMAIGTACGRSDEHLSQTSTAGQDHHHRHGDGTAFLCSDPNPSPGCPWRSDTTMRSETPHDLPQPPQSRYSKDEVRVLTTICVSRICCMVGRSPHDKMPPLPCVQQTRRLAFIRGVFSDDSQTVPFLISIDVFPCRDVVNGSVVRAHDFESTHMQRHNHTRISPHSDTSLCPATHE